MIVGLRLRVSASPHCLRYFCALRPPCSWCWVSIAHYPPLCEQSLTWSESWWQERVIFFGKTDRERRSSRAACKKSQVKRGGLVESGCWCVHALEQAYSLVDGVRPLGRLGIGRKRACTQCMRENTDLGSSCWLLASAASGGTTSFPEGGMGVEGDEGRSFACSP